MQREECLSILADVLQNLQTSPPDDGSLSSLSYVVSLSANDESIRDFLGLSVSVWTKISEIIGYFVDQLAPTLDESQLSIWRLRLVRGVVLTARNLVVGVKNALSTEEDMRRVLPSCPNLNTRELYAVIIQNQKHVTQLVTYCLDSLELAKRSPPESVNIYNVEIYMKTIAACFQYLTNLSSRSGDSDDHNNNDDIANHISLEGVSPLLHRVLLFDNDIDSLPADSHIKVLGNTEVMTPLWIYVNNISCHDRIIQEFFDSPMASRLIKYFMHEYHFAEGEHLDEVSDVDNLKISISFKIVTHDGFLGFGNKLLAEGDKDLLYQMLMLLQFLSGVEDCHWESDRLTILVTGLLNSYRVLASEATKILQLSTLSDDDKVTLAQNNRCMVAALSTLSGICQYDHVRNYLNAYKFLPELITFLHLVHNNTERKKLKDTTMSEKHYPGVKSVIIEIVTFLVYENFENQEIVRTTHALEVVLSNCNIDRDEPFVKERAILCIKYLLQNNPANQEFVRKLEAEQTVISKEDESLLERTGFEVDIVDGKVQLKKK